MAHFEQVTATPDSTGATVELYPNTAQPPSPDRDNVVCMSVGRVLNDRYVIQEKLGTGGNGTVFRALDRYRASLAEAPRFVALKVLHCGRECAEETVEDLRREVRCAQVLSHRNIIHVFELEQDQDVVFFTMELLEGDLLDNLLERLRPSALHRSQAWQMIRQLGAGLAHAHQRGIVHGDLKPRNIWVTREGELRILDFGAAHNIPSDNGQPDGVPRSGTPAYASCELLEGRTTDPRDDLYALACICYELLTGAHPFARRQATLARDFGIQATRPAGLSGRQWKTLQTGLAWHRAGRSMRVHVWIQKLTPHLSQTPSMTPLRELKAAVATKPLLPARAAAALVAVLLIAGASIAQLRVTSARKTTDGALTHVAPSPVATHTSAAAAPSSEVAPPPGALVAHASTASAPNVVDGMAEAKPLVQQTPLRISVDGYHVSAGDHFVEIRVHRNQLQKNASFAWWTEPATARENIDYVHQAKAIQTFASKRRSTRFYVKLLPDSGRSQRNYFYIAIAQPARDRLSNKVTRVQIWLPTPRDQLQARR